MPAAVELSSSPLLYASSLGTSESELPSAVVFSPNTSSSTFHAHCPGRRTQYLAIHHSQAECNLEEEQQLYHQWPDPDWFKFPSESFALDSPTSTYHGFQGGGFPQCHPSSFPCEDPILSSADDCSWPYPQGNQVLQVEAGSRVGVGDGSLIQREPSSGLLPGWPSYPCDNDLSQNSIEYSSYSIDWLDARADVSSVDAFRHTDSICPSSVDFEPQFSSLSSDMSTSCNVLAPSPLCCRSGGQADSEKRLSSSTPAAPLADTMVPVSSSSLLSRSPSPVSRPPSPVSRSPPPLSPPVEVMYNIVDVSTGSCSMQSDVRATFSPDLVDASLVKTNAVSMRKQSKGPSLRKRYFRSTSVNVGFAVSDPDSISTHEKKRAYLDGLEEYVLWLEDQVRSTGRVPIPMRRISNYPELGTKSTRNWWGGLRAVDPHSEAVRAAGTPSAKGGSTGRIQSFTQCRRNGSRTVHQNVTRRSTGVIAILCNLDTIRDIGAAMTTWGVRYHARARTFPKSDTVIASYIDSASLLSEGIVTKGGRLMLEVLSERLWMVEKRSGRLTIEEFSQRMLVT
ncbi:hypothetical protein C8Q76DRAFT_693612 [Earliella scabrosa]|nr:hypothetical protein C8Q76DRAFT_693612 [Earliella scabrosa]